MLTLLPSPGLPGERAAEAVPALAQHFFTREGSNSPARRTFLQLAFEEQVSFRALS